MVKKRIGYKMLKRLAVAGVVVFSGLAGTAYAQAVGDAPIVTDSRIKTFVYSENEVFRLVMHYGFQSHIVFDKNETIQTVSLGDSYAWKVTPVENRIFLKPLEEASYTNMTVVTDKRTYQFDLVSKRAKENAEDALVYMVRFYYPSGTFDMPYPANAPIAAAPASAPAMMSPIPSAMPPSAPEPAMPIASPYNFNYTLSGPDAVAPDRVFDDGQKTYFEFPAGMSTPNISMVQNGQEVPLNQFKQGGFIVVNGIAKMFCVHAGGNVLYVYNESI